MHRPKVIAFDLDGTLAESKQRMASEMGDLLGTLMQDTPVAVLSGAGFFQFQKQFLPAIPMEAKLENLYIFPVNAAQCYIYRDGAWKPQYDHSFTPTEKEKILTELNAALAEVGLTEEPTEIWGERIEDREAQISFSPLGQQAPVEAKGRWAKEYGDKRRTLYSILIKTLPDFAVAMGGMTTIDITRKGITKAYGVVRLSELTKVPITEMLYVGDALDEGGNDSVVLETGIPTHAVFGPHETEAFIETLTNKIH